MNRRELIALVGGLAALRPLTGATQPTKIPIIGMLSTLSDRAAWLVPAFNEGLRATGYIDGQQWFQSTDSSTLPPGKMHLAIQLDYFPDGGSPKPTQMDVDFVRIYR